MMLARIHKFQKRITSRLVHQQRIGGLMGFAGVFLSFASAMGQTTILPPTNYEYPSVTAEAPTNSPYLMTPEQLQLAIAESEKRLAQVANQYPTVDNSYGQAIGAYGNQVPVVGSGATETLPAPVPVPESMGEALEQMGSGDATALELSSEQKAEMDASGAGLAGLPWYQYPFSWFPRDGWISSIEFGLNGTSGNSNTTSYAAGADLTRTGLIYTVGLNLDYRNTKASGQNTQDNARMNFELDRAIAESAFSTFYKMGLEYDRFKAFDLRVNINGGISYFISKTEDFIFATRLGAGASSEIGSVNPDWKPEALFGLDYKHQINRRNRVYAIIDYFPAFRDFSDYRVVTDTGWEILLSDDNNFSLKLSAINRHDSTPLGLKPNDIDYAATLLYKF